MRTVQCPLCGLRFAHTTELDAHARDDHAPPPAAERHEAIVVPAARAARACGPGEVLRLPW